MILARRDGETKYFARFFGHYLKAKNLSLDEQLNTF